ncbi:prolyl oligopeptidase family serine peptidase [Gemmata sp. JC673]|uniref:Prolyl oligopeptidase family serine peptidase n=1 Tax=Gemmata algarum TaxID=2975278 RepID=A0ABU5F8Y7_9BACT|nr:prolyl oligopeptidase family serine peptidase [Gemmata algarum]MDY3562858.1 prolyl oligopeptidase family serine peptidase [Gemmata algarum]
MRGTCHFLRRSAACVGLIALAGLLHAEAADMPAVERAPAPRLMGAPAPTELTPLSRESYLLPPKDIADAVLASRGEIVALTNLSPDGRKFLVVKRDALPPVERLGCPCVHLAEMAFDPVACRSRDLWVNSAEAFELFFPVENRTVPVKAPAGARVASPAWSPDGSKLAFLALFSDATHICVADTETGACRQITKTPVLATLVTTLQWTLDGTRLQTVLLPDGGKRPVPQPGVADSPKVRVARDGKDPSRTYRYLLESPYQMRLLEHLLTGQVALVRVADGSVTNVGEPAMVRSVSAAPGEGAFRVSTVKKPFSYYAPFQRFGALEAVWDGRGQSLVTLSDRNLREGEPQPAAPAPTAPTAPKGGLTKGAGGKGGVPVTDPTQPMVPNPTQPVPTNPMNPDDPTPVAPEPFDPDAKRDLNWRPDGKGMSFLQLEPTGKDDKKDEAKKDVKKDEAKKDDTKTARKDRVMQWLPPFGKDDAKVVYESPNRITAAQYSADGKWLFVSQTVDSARQITAVDLADPKKSYVVSRGGTGFGAPKKGDAPPKKNEPAEREQPPGFRGGATFGVGLLSKPVAGGSAVRVSGAGEVYLSGTERGRGAGEASQPRPYIDAINITTGKKTRVFESKSDLPETVDAVDGDDITRVFTTRQNTKVVPNCFMTEPATGKVTKLTNNVDRAPWFHELKTERFRVTRVDGFKFWVKVTLPPKAEGKLPALFWIYPREYTDQADYDQKAGRGGAAAVGPGRFTGPTPRHVAILTLAGYAVVEPDVPIVGPAGKMNDNYVSDLRNGLWAAIDECDKRGLIDRDRLACGGHSYGAFSTANALTHTPFFKAGIAGDGCYNRTLTSMTFQSERRQLWDARETYLEMSPLLRANQINGALLMYHGMEDANVGTHPMNSEALFAALDGLGKPAALYMYPYEGHGPISRETNLDLWARWIAWLDTYVKNPKKK